MAMQLKTLQSMVTPEGVSDSLDDQIYASLTYNDTKNATIACRSAARWCYGFLGKYGRLDASFSDDDLEVLTEAMTQMAIYELLLISQFDENGDQYKEDAENLLNAVLGITKDGDGQSTFVGGATAKDEKSHIAKPYCALAHRNKSIW
ncbi:hypothetical protein HJ158_08185 [Vibrio parahaemolyticus]|nr:hypothetical protein [Vibrio parahaemolyticus]